MQGEFFSLTPGRVTMAPIGLAGSMLPWHGGTDQAEHSSLSHSILPGNRTRIHRNCWLLALTPSPLAPGNAFHPLPFTIQNLVSAQPMPPRHASLEKLVQTYSAMGRLAESFAQASLQLCWHENALQQFCDNIALAQLHLYLNKLHP